MKIARRQFLHLGAVAIALPTVSQIARAQVYPTRPVTMIVPFAAGGPTDVIARLLADGLNASLGQPIIVENVAGANGSIGVGRLARAKPDGYTIDFGFLGGHVLNGALYKLPYDVLSDFEPIIPLVTSPFVLFTRKTMAAKNLGELIDWLKANPERASAGVQSVGAQIVAMTFQKHTGTRFALVPYRGTAPAMQDLVAGQIDLLLETLIQLPLVRGGSIKAFAVTSDTRQPQARDIPTFAEMGLPAVSWSFWYGLFAPRSTPGGVIAKLNTAAVEVLSDPVVRSRLVDLGFEIMPTDRQTPQALGSLVKDDAAKWWPIIRETGLKLE